MFLAWRHIGIFFSLMIYTHYASKNIIVYLLLSATKNENYIFILCCSVLNIVQQALKSEKGHAISSSVQAVLELRLLWYSTRSPSLPRAKMKCVVFGTPKKSSIMLKNGTCHLTSLVIAKTTLHPVRESQLRTVSCSDQDGVLQ